MPIVEVDKLVKRYAGARTNAVDGVSFVIEPGEFFALLGPNGAGKTTIISILTTTLAPTDGNVFIAGHDLARAANRVRREVGIIFQRPSLDMNLTAEENVRFHAILYGLYPFRPGFALMPRAYRDQVRELARILGLDDELFKPIKTFSGGMRRKLEIIRSLMHRPRILFLDEPTLGLDPSSRRTLWQYLVDVRAASGTTILLTTHYLEEAEQADRICVIDHGHVVAYGTPEQLKSQLIRDYILVEADDRSRLFTELAELGLEFFEQGRHVRVNVAGSQIHAVLKQIQTPLRSVRTHTPTLEDAYLEIIGRGDAASQVAGDIAIAESGGA
jgi:ABC-2 type transport system ATP-binding protein